MIIYVFLLDGLQSYYDVNHKFPSRIVVYRDGVGDGMIQHVFDYEVGQMKEGIKEILKDEPYKLSFVIVTKRINTRFFLKLERPNLDNPLPGTVVDTEVTRPERYEFFLVSQSVRQGTVGPTNYNVIEDTSGFPPKNMQALTYKLCHMYFNWMVSF